MLVIKGGGGVKIFGFFSTFFTWIKASFNLCTSFSASSLFEISAFFPSTLVRFAIKISLSFVSSFASIFQNSLGTKFSISLSRSTINFTATAKDEDGVIKTYEWNFGDGKTSTDTNPTHIYIEAGTYTVSCKVTDDRDGYSKKKY